ncbi:MAG: efflux RND transporter permease subunit [Gammaproteobacteria bacterium]|nr:efflux RND transporter permease subunit [Gammaproteobacteria bacterium]
MKHAVIRLATEKPGTVYAVIVLLVAITGALMSRIQIDTDPENMLSADQTDRVFHNEVENRFTYWDAIVVGIVNEEHPNGIYNVESLTALHSLSTAILELDGVIAPDLASLSRVDNIEQEGPGTIRFEWLMRDAPVTTEQSLGIRDKVNRLPLLKDSLVSGDGKAATIYVPIASKDLSYTLSEEIQDLIDKLDSGDEFHITGLPVAEDTFGHDMFVQMGISAPLAGLMIFILMLWFFRSPQLVIAPMLVAMATVVISMGLLIGLGFTVHIMSSMIPIFLMPIAVVDSVHIMSEFADNYREGADAKKVISQTVEHLFTPMLFTSLTSAIGFFSLLLTPIPPVQIFGAFVGFGILLAFILTIVLIPAYVVRMKPASLDKLATRAKTPHTKTALARSLRRSGRFALRRGKLISGFAVLVLAVSVAGIMRIEINDNPVRWFKSSHPIRVADDVLNEHFAGTYDAFVVLTHQDDEALPRFMVTATQLLDDVDELIAEPVRKALSADNPDNAAWYDNVIGFIDDALFEAADETSIEALENLLSSAEEAQVAAKYFQRPDALHYISNMQVALDESGYVGKSNTVADVVKVVNRELRGGDDANYRIPESVPAVAQTLMQYQSSHRPHDLWHIVTPDFSSTVVWLQMKSGDNQDMSRVIDFLDAWIADNPLPASVEVHWAGKTYINVVWQDVMVSGMLNSLLGAFAVVFLMMTMLFRSWRIGLMAMVPLTVTILGVYGIIGWIGKDYDMPIAVLSSLTLGLSVDFAIHFIERTRALLRRSGCFEEATRLIFEEPARAIARNAIVIAIGFTPLFFAPLVPYITVGAFMAAIMALSGVTTLILLPALMSWAGPWLFPEMKERGAFIATNAQTVAG